MIAITIKGVREFARYVDKVKGRSKAVADRFGPRAALMMETHLRRVSFSGKKGRHPFFGVTSPDPSTGTVGARTGHTRASITSRTFRKGSSYFAASGTPMKHAKLHEDGGVIHGKPFLRIPLAPAQTGSGQDRNLGRSVRGDKSFFVWPTRRMKRSGSLFLAKRSRGRLVLWYLLKKTVRLKPRKMFERAARMLFPRITKATRDAFVRVVRP